MSVGKIGMNLSNNCKTNDLRLLCFKFLAFGNRNDNNGLKLPEECLKLELFGKVLMALVSINKLLILYYRGKDRDRLISKHLTIQFTHTDERCISAIHTFRNNIMRMHDVPTFKATQFAPVLNHLRNNLTNDVWPDTEPGHQTAHEDFADSVIKATHSLRSHQFVLWVCNELSLDLV